MHITRPRYKTIRRHFNETEKQEILLYADKHTVTAASVHFDVAKTVIYRWRALKNGSLPKTESNDLFRTRVVRDIIPGTHGMVRIVRGGCKSATLEFIVQQPVINRAQAKELAVLFTKLYNGLEE